MKHIFSVGICLLLILNASAQNGFVITGKLPKAPIRSFANNIFIISEGDNLLAYDSTGRKIAEGKSIEYFANDMFIVDSVYNNLKYYGVVNSKGETIIKKKYIELGAIKNGLALAKNGYSKYGYLNSKGDTILPFTFKTATPFYDGVATVECDFRNFGVIDTKGNFILPCRDPKGPLGGLFGAEAFKNGLAVVNVEDLYLSKYSIINKKGKILIPPTKFVPDILANNFFVVDKSVYVYNEEADTVNVLSVTAPTQIGNGIVKAQQNGDFVVYNSKGKFMFRKSPTYAISGFNGNTFTAYNTSTKSFCLLDTTGKEIIPTPASKLLVDNMNAAFDGYSRIIKENLMGILNNKGKIIVPPQFTDLDWRWYGINNKDFHSTYSWAKYQEDWIIFRPKTSSELKKEEQLIAQKKLPTAEDCFKKAKEWVEKKKAEQASIVSNNNAQTPSASNIKSIEKTNSIGTSDIEEEKRFKTMKTDIVNRLKKLYQSFLALDKTSYNGNVQCLDASKAFAKASKEYKNFMSTSGYTSSNYPFKNHWVKEYNKWGNFLNNESKLRDDLEKFMAKLLEGLDYSENQFNKNGKVVSFSNKLESTDYYFRKRIQGFIEMYEYYN